MINRVNIQSKKKSLRISLNTREKNLKYSLIKLPTVSGIRNSISFALNTSNLGSPEVKANSSISKIDNNSNKKNMNLSNEVRNALL